VLLSLYAHLSRPFWTGQPLAYPAVKKTGAAAEPPATGYREFNLKALRSLQSLKIERK
jgi:hypothetical protein